MINYLERFIRNAATILCKRSLNIKTGDKVLITSISATLDFALEICKQAVLLTPTVYVAVFEDGKQAISQYTYNSCIEQFQLVKVEDQLQIAQSLGCDLESLCNLTILADEIIDLQERQMTANTRGQIVGDQMRWCAAPCPTAKWARQLHGDALEGLQLLSKQLCAACSLDCETEAECLRQFDENEFVLKRRAEKLNSASFFKLRFTSLSAGTKLNVFLNENSKWIGGSFAVQGHPDLLFSPNLPSYELFTAPDRAKTSGFVRGARPLFFENALIEGWWFVFEEGQAVDYGAKVGLDALEKLMRYESSVQFLGEIALVDNQSPIAKIHQLFYQTLLDENASCHMALGEAFSASSKTGRKETWMNSCCKHKDFMIGSPDIQVIGYRRDESGEVVEVPIIRDGLFVF